MGNFFCIVKFWCKCLLAKLTCHAIEWLSWMIKMCVLTLSRFVWRHGFITWVIYLGLKNVPIVYFSHFTCLVRMKWMQRPLAGATTRSSYVWVVSKVHPHKRVAQADQRAHVWMRILGECTPCGHVFVTKDGLYTIPCILEISQFQQYMSLMSLKLLSFMKCNWFATYFP